MTQQIIPKIPTKTLSDLNTLPPSRHQIGSLVIVRSTPLLDFYIVRRGEDRIGDIAGVDDVRGFEDQHLRFIVGRGPMLDAARHDDHFSWSHVNDTVAKFDTEAPVPHQEHLVDVGMAVPWKHALHLHEFDFLTIEPRRNPGAPVLVDQGKFRADVDCCHEGMPFDRPDPSADRSDAPLAARQADWSRTWD